MNWDDCEARLRELMARAPLPFTCAIATKAAWSSMARSGFCGAIALSIDDVAPSELAEARYPRATFRRWRLAGPDLASVIMTVLRGETAEPRHPSWQRFDGSFGALRPAWPRHELRFSTATESADANPREPLLALGLPAYPNLGAALDTWFPVRNSYPGSWTVLVPDRRARIVGVEFRGDGQLDVGVESNMGGAALEVHVVLASMQRESVQRDHQRVEAGRTVFALQHEATRGTAYLLGPNDEVLDTHALQRAPLEPQALDGQSVLDRSSIDLRDGEDEHVEIKPWITPKEHKEHELLQTIIAFANTDGGRLYIGAGDDGVPLGRGELLKRFKPSVGRTPEQAALERIEQLVLDGLIRPPPYKVHVVELAEGPLLCVEVEAGPDQPYATKHNEILVRRRASNRRPEAHLVSLASSRGPTWTPHGT
jgi:hypothetical protein